MHQHFVDSLLLLESICREGEVYLRTINYLNSPVKLFIIIKAEPCLQSWIIVLIIFINKIPGNLGSRDINHGDSIIKASQTCVCKQGHHIHNIEDKSVSSPDAGLDIWRHVMKRRIIFLTFDVKCFMTSLLSSFRYLSLSLSCILKICTRNPRISKKFKNQKSKSSLNLGLFLCSSP